ncbi:MAG: DUF2461 domain-containing protein [Bacteroidetes bacterium]|nr:DUF2461 domain-containing protein [Bacteroidota bacterium]
MSYFTPAFFRFFDQLKKNNNKEWFDKNRETYEKEVKGPFKQFVTRIMTELAKDHPDFQQNPSKAIFRINRDIRFSKDKSPYKTNVGALFNRSGTKDVRPGYYLHIGAGEVFLGGGMYDVDKANLEKIRQEIYYNADTFKKLLADKSFKALYGGVVQGEQNKILPAEYKEFAKEQPYIANKQFYYMAQLKKEDVLSKDFDKVVLKHYKAAAKFNDFLLHAIAD